MIETVARENIPVLAIILSHYDTTGVLLLCLFLQKTTLEQNLSILANQLALITYVEHFRLR